MEPNPHRATPRLTLDTVINGAPATLVAYVAGDPGVYDEFGIDLVSQEGTMQLATAGVSRNASLDNGYDVHGYTYIANGRDPSSIVSLAMNSRHVNVEVDTPFLQAAHAKTLSHKEVDDVYWSVATPETVTHDDEDVIGFVATLSNAFVSCGAGRYDYLKEEHHRLDVRVVNGMTFVGQDDAYLNVTGDSLTSVADVALSFVNGEIDKSKCIAGETLRLWAERRDAR